MCITRRPGVNLFYMSVLASTNVDRILGYYGITGVFKEVVWTFPGAW